MNLIYLNSYNIYKKYFISLTLLKMNDRNQLKLLKFKNVLFTFNSFKN